MNVLGEAYIDGCGECVGGSTTGEALNVIRTVMAGIMEALPSEMIVDVCAGGDTGIRAKSRLRL